MLKRVTVYPYLLLTTDPHTRVDVSGHIPTAFVLHHTTGTAYTKARDFIDVFECAVQIMKIRTLTRAWHICLLFENMYIHIHFTRVHHRSVMVQLYSLVYVRRRCCVTRGKNHPLDQTSDLFTILVTCMCVYKAQSTKT